MNDAGVVVGQSEISSTVWVDHAFVWSSDGGIQDLDLHDGHPYRQTIATGINDRGHVVCGDHERVFIWSPSTGRVEVPRGPLDQSYNFTSSGINDDGNVVLGGVVGGRSVAAIHRAGATSLLSAPAGVGSFALRVNNRNQAVGAVGSVPTSWSEVGERTSLPLPAGASGGMAMDVNEDGVIVGYSMRSVPMGGWTRHSFHAALWRDGEFYSFDELTVNPEAGWELAEANAINDAGLVGGVGQRDGRQAFFMAIPAPELAVDVDRDGVIALASESSTDQTNPEEPFRFWSNDDDDSGSLSTCDIPGSSTPDGHKAKVQGVRDLIDYFPIFLDVKQLLGVLPPARNGITYKLKQADDAVRFLYTDLSRDDAFKYLTDNATGTALKDANAHWVTAAGYSLDATWLEEVEDGDKGVILVTGRNPTDKPLRLVVEKAGVEIAAVSLNIKISAVEDMFRHLNLREGADAAPGLVGDRRDNGKPTRLDDPVGLPDASPNQPWFIFLVGSNVGGQSARGWEAETFKRFYWSRGDDGKFATTRFLGVSWFGDPYSNAGDGVYDYHLAVRNAFATAPALASRVNSLPGAGAKTIGGHSLACGVIAAALSDHGMDVNHAVLVDAAVAREAFDGRAGSGDHLSAEESGMTPAVWRNYSRRLQSPSWHERFTDVSGDNRQALTWRNRFIGAVPKIHSFYSSTEDVLGSYNGEVPSTALGAAAVVITNGAAFTAYVWVYQEKAKGNRQDYSMIGIGSFHAGSTYMGWGMNLKDPLLSGDPPHWKWVDSHDYIGRMIKTPAEIGDVSDSVLRRHPVFEPGWGVARKQEQQEIPVSNVSSVAKAPSWIYELYGATSGSTQAGVKASANHAQLLAEAIPAQSWAVGSHNTEAFEERNYNLPVLFTGPGWPRSLISGVREWRHSDMREVPYLHQSRFWDKLVSVSQQP